MPERLKRLDLVYQHSPIYFITACMAERRKLLATKQFTVFVAIDAGKIEFVPLDEIAERHAFF